MLNSDHYVRRERNQSCITAKSSPQSLAANRFLCWEVYSGGKHSSKKMKCVLGLSLRSNVSSSIPSIETPLEPISTDCKFLQPLFNSLEIHRATCPSSMLFSNFFLLNKTVNEFKLWILWRDGKDWSSMEEAISNYSVWSFGKKSITSLKSF